MARVASRQSISQRSNLKGSESEVGTNPRMPYQLGSLVPVALISGLLFAATLCVFFPAVHNGFIYWYGDDPIYVLDNPHVQNGLTWESIKWAFGSMELSTWFPVTWLSYMLDCELFGLKPAGFHLTNILIHSANVALLFLTLRQMTGAMWRSAAVALLFGLHPLRVESVAWIAERKDVLSTFFWILTLLMYGLYVQAKQNANRRSRTFYGFALLFFVCGLMSKAMVVTLPCVLLLLDFWPLERTIGERKMSVKTLIAEKLPFVIPVLIVSVITYVAQSDWGYVEGLEKYPFSSRIQTTVVSYARYLQKICWPANLCHVYEHPGKWPVTTVTLSLLLLLAISTFAVALRRRAPYVLWGWLWFLGTLVPVIGIVQLGSQSLGNRFVYIPTIGLLIAFVWGFHQLIARWHLKAVFSTALLIALVAPCIATTRKEISYFKDGLTLWKHDMDVGGKHGLAHYAYALSLNSEGRAEEAITEMRDIIRAKPNWIDARVNLASMLAKHGELDEAVVECQKALISDPEDAKACRLLGTVFRQQGEIDNAIEWFQRAVKSMPNFVEAHYDLALALSQKGLNEASVSELNKVLQLNPTHPDAHNALGATFASVGNWEQAIFHFREAVKAAPTLAETHNNLGMALASSGHLDEAAQQFEQALRANPSFQPAREHLADVKQALSSKQ